MVAASSISSDSSVFVLVLFGSPFPGSWEFCDIIVDALISIWFFNPRNLAENLEMKEAYNIGVFYYLSWFLETHSTRVNLLKVSIFIVNFRQNLIIISIVDFKRWL